jgi:hypothetical protein
MTIVILETETDSKHFPRIDSCFSYKSKEQNGTHSNLFLKNFQITDQRTGGHLVIFTCS